MKNNKLPKYIQERIIILAKNSKTVKEQNDDLLYYFQKKGFLNDDFDGIINDALIDMTSQNFEPLETIKLIEEVMSGVYEDER